MGLSNRREFFAAAAANSVRLFYNLLCKIFIDSIVTERASALDDRLVSARIATGGSPAGLEIP